ncbi:hypothetical protein C5C07_20040 [Haloferax sp. Atlit-4N]|nr:hypothetical protein C5C07_20040 [Haloferax sp. Atlit-4N]
MSQENHSDRQDGPHETDAETTNRLRTRRVRLKNHLTRRKTLLIDVTILCTLLGGLKTLVEISLLS